MKNGGAITRGYSSKRLRRALRGPDFSPQWHQGYFEARDCALAYEPIRLRPIEEIERRGARTLFAPEHWDGVGRQGVLDYIDGALRFFEIAGLN